MPEYGVVIMTVMWAEIIASSYTWLWCDSEENLMMFGELRNCWSAVWWALSFVRQLTGKHLLECGKGRGCSHVRPLSVREDDRAGQMASLCISNRTICHLTHHQALTPPHCHLSTTSLYHPSTSSLPPHYHLPTTSLPPLYRPSTTSLSPHYHLSTFSLPPHYHLSIISVQLIATSTSISLASDLFIRLSYAGNLNSCVWQQMHILQVNMPGEVGHNVFQVFHCILLAGCCDGVVAGSGVVSTQTAGQGGTRPHLHPYLVALFEQQLPW